MNDLKETKTLKNLMSAFAGESQARNRYTYYSSIAKKEGFIEISRIFEETANHEKEHAKRLFKFLKDSGVDVEISGTFPTLMSSTENNLKASAVGENHEWAEMYPTFAKEAQDEGFSKIAAVFKSIAVAEKFHEERYKRILDRIEENKVFSADNAVKWQCQNCGYIHRGNNALEECPACAHPKAYFARSLWD
ncbi:MAG: rubrerythrin family protein [Bacteriovoracaceae bacterium]|nr:rubrerythrin family protein [Bacteriovoracaceae bacterium]